MAATWTRRDERRRHGNYNVGLNDTDPEGERDLERAADDDPRIERVLELARPSGGGATRAAPTPEEVR